ncbi:hypothetical protein HU200_020715 [Digitaria exilis]|uniref:Uncharacterized protein n=1 Tax=Digitaria exilis TaxID=1010633 RepID=A0A835KDL6_9POAL|nr:hypothetical protein HU200_020715 [Digitaria exilis]
MAAAATSFTTLAIARPATAAAASGQRVLLASKASSPLLSLSGARLPAQAVSFSGAFSLRPPTAVRASSHPPALNPRCHLYRHYRC